MAEFIEVHDTEGNAHCVNTDEIAEVTGNTIYLRTIVPVAADYPHITCAETYEEIKQMLKNEEPIAKNQPNVHAYWIHTGKTNIFGGHQHECSNCHYSLMVSEMCNNENYCCNCGARMEREQE